MKTVFTMSGNVRTFFMPLRENHSIRLCDSILRDVIAPNNADVFLYTDSNDFYLNGVHYFEKSKKIEVLNGDSDRIYSNVEFIDHEEAAKLIETNIRSLLGDRLKGIVVERPIDVSSDPKTLLLKDGFDKGCMPEMMTHQYRKLSLVYKMVEEYEKSNGRYDVIIKSRPDVFIGPLYVHGYNWNNTDVFVPGYSGPSIVYDWCAVGLRDKMHYYLNLFDALGSTRSFGRTFKCSCNNSITVDCDYKDDGKDFPVIPCPKCGKPDILRSEDITISAEHHLCRIFQVHGIRHSLMGTNVQVYRYRVTNERIEDTIKSMNKGKISVVKHFIDKNKVEEVI